eukprot:2449940-Rhodomonas_salina.1
MAGKLLLRPLILALCRAPIPVDQIPIITLLSPLAFPIPTRFHQVHLPSHPVSAPPGRHSLTPYPRPNSKPFSGADMPVRAGLRQMDSGARRPVPCRTKDKQQVQIVLTTRFVLGECGVQAGWSADLERKAGDDAVCRGNDSQAGGEAEGELSGGAEDARGGGGRGAVDGVVEVYA